MTRPLLSWSNRLSAVVLATLLLVFANTGIARSQSQASLRANLNSCISGYFDCDQSLLKPTEKQYVYGALLKRNLNSCISGYFDCDQSLLSQEQATNLLSAAPPAQKLFGKGCAENGSCYGDISTLTGRPKTVRVKGYTRKDGTYVRGYYRSKKR